MAAEIAPDEITQLVEGREALNEAREAQRQAEINLASRMRAIHRRGVGLRAIAAACGYSRTWVGKRISDPPR